MAAPILPNLFPRPPLGPPPPPHHQLCFPPMAPWDLPPPPVQFFPVSDSHHSQPPAPIIGTVYNFVPGLGPGPGFRGGRGFGYHHQRGFRGRGPGGRGGGGRRGGGPSGSGGQAAIAPQSSHHVEKKIQKPAEFSCKVCNKDYRSEESYQIHLQSHQKVCFIVVQWCCHEIVYPCPIVPLLCLMHFCTSWQS